MKPFLGLLIFVAVATNAFADETTTSQQQQQQQLRARQQQQQQQLAKNPQARPRPRGYKKFIIGGLLGPGIPTGDFHDLGTKIAFGFNADYKLSRQFALGIYLLHTSGSFTNSTSEQSFTLNFYGAEANYFYPNGFNFGARIGLSSIKATITDSTGTLGGTTTPFAFGPRMGWDFRIGRLPMTIGPELSLLFVSKSTASDPTTGLTLNTPSFGVFTAMAALKYWF